jgi:alcohol dehydrogenase class IV
MSNVFLGSNALDSLHDLIESNGFKKVFLVTNRNSFISFGLDKLIYQQLIGCQYVRFYEFEVNPKVEDVIKGIDYFLKEDPDFVIAVGGGSAMDMAKLINAFAPETYRNPKDIQKHIDENKPIKKYAPLMAIPTTSGSGSEATKFAVMYIDGKKYSLDDQKIEPDFVLIDPVITKDLPKNITAYTGMDALAQAIESYWAKAATRESQEYAIKAIELIYPNLLKAVRQPDLDAREHMALGSYYAGKAINITRTTAPHALSYAITTEYGIPHGHAVALTLPHVLVENAAHCDLHLVYQAIGATDADDAKKKLLELMQAIGLETSFEKLGVTDVTMLAKAVNPERLKNNPKEFTTDELLLMLKQI